MKTIVIAGANGFMGRYLGGWYLKKGWRVIGLARREEGLAEGVKFIRWDGKCIGEWSDCLEGAEALINLAGRTVNCRYHEENRKQILESRVDSTQVLGEAVRGCEIPPKLWMNSSTATIYRHAEDRAQGDFDGEIGEGFSVEIARAWEKAFFDAEVCGEVRKIALRTAIVMAEEKGTVWDVLGKLARLRLGGKMGSGRQMVSWIHVDDFCRCIDWFIEREECSGIYNVSAPNPLTNRDLMQLIRCANGVKFGLPATKWMLEIGAFFMRTETELILKSRWVLPTRLLEEGFGFKYEFLGDGFGIIPQSWCPHQV